MGSLQEHLIKLKEERVAREKARIEKLRELNLKKYSANESQASMSTTSFARRTSRINTGTNGSFKPGNTSRIIVIKAEKSKTASEKQPKPASNKTDFIVNGAARRSIAAPVPSKVKSRDSTTNLKPRTFTASLATNSHAKKVEKKVVEAKKVGDVRSGNSGVFQKALLDFKKPKPKVASNITAKGDVTVARSVVDARNGQSNARGDTVARKANADARNGQTNAIVSKPAVEVRSGLKVARKSFVPASINAKTMPNMTRKSFAPRFDYQKPTITVTKPTPKTRQSFQPNYPHTASKLDNTKTQSVFERLYQPKFVHKPIVIDDAQKLRSEPAYLNKLLKNTRLILNKRHTVFEHSRASQTLPVRRSISAVHFKRIGKHEIPNCIHKWSSIGDKLDKVSLGDINEDETVRQDKIVSAVKSERKKVKFQTPVPNFNTPRPEELQQRLQNWLKKRGKSLDSYHHLQCFGIHHLTQKEIRPLNLDKARLEPASETKIGDQSGKVESEDNQETFDDENKENEPLASDSDDGSYTDNMNDRTEDFKAPSFKDKWRKASFMSEADMNETQDTSLTSTELVHHVDELLLGALNDLTELLREGFDWEQCARWLRAIRERFPNASDSAAYWECRAALEERRGDLPASVQCWEEAIAKGTERSVVEANLDQLLDKFMQLKISPNSRRARQPDPKMVDVKNVFKSTLIRFAVQQAKLRQSETPKFTVTPVRRSARLSAHWSGKRTPLTVCTSVRQAGLLGHPVTFVPNDKLVGTP